MHHIHVKEAPILTFVTMENIVAALKNTLGRKGMHDDEITELAEYIMSFFGYESEVIDNILSSEDRDVFYMLEEEGIISTTQEQVNLKKGKLWRIHYWVLKGEHIDRLAQEKAVVEKVGDEYEQVYGDMGDDVWNRHSEDADDEKH